MTARKSNQQKPQQKQHSKDLEQDATIKPALTEGTKFDQSKPDYSLLSSYAIEELVKVLDFGATKYEEHNWRKGIKTSRLLAACLRHTFAFLRGEDNDPETGLSHMSHAMCCAMFIVEQQKFRKSFDDRFIAE